ncbi:hypothetical protein Tco_1306548, partial [Tanacetum coccineum]
MDEEIKNYSFAHILTGSNPSSLVDKTKSAEDGLKTTHTTSGDNEESKADDISQKVNLEDLSDILKDTRCAFFTPYSPTDEPIIVSYESEEEDNAGKVHLLQSQMEELEKAKLKAEAEVVSMKTKPLYPDINQLTKLLVTSLKPKLSKLLASHNFASFLPTELKELPSKITVLSREIKELKQHIKDILLHKVTYTLNSFSTMVDNASRATSMNVPSAGQAAALPTQGEKNTKDIDKSEKGWKTIYDLVKTRVDKLTQTEQELKIDLNQPLKEQDPLNELIDLANKKRKRTSDLRDHSSPSASVAEVPSASALHVLRRLGSIFTSVYAVVQKLKKDSWLELQFSLADNSKLNV